MGELSNTEIQRVREAAQEATWPLAVPRWFAVDYDNGLDTNIGFSDVSSAAAGAVAKKTWEGLLAILPRVARGQEARIAVRARANGVAYRNAADTADASLDLIGFSGYNSIAIRPTDTVASAGSTAFANDTNDRICMGMRTSLNAAGYKFTKATATIVGATNAGPVVVEHDGVLTFTAGEYITISGANDAAGGSVAYINSKSWKVGTVVDPTHFELENSNGSTFPSLATCGGTITRYKVVKADNSPPALGVDTLLGLRVRGDIATTTVANRNLTRAIWAHGDDTVVLESDITTVDAADIWYLEEPGVNFSFIKLHNNSTEVHIGPIGSPQFSALDNNAQIYAYGTKGPASFNVIRCRGFTCQQSWSIDGTVQVAAFVHGEGFFSQVNSLNLTGFVVSEAFTAEDVPFFSLRHLVGSPDSFSSCSLNRVGYSPELTIINIANCRFVRAVSMSRSNLSLSDCQIETFPGAGANGFTFSSNGSSLFFNNIADHREIALVESTTNRNGLRIGGVDNRITFQRGVYLRGTTNYGSRGIPGEIIFSVASQTANIAAGLRCVDLYLSDVRDWNGNRVSVMTEDTLTLSSPRINQGVTGNATALYRNDGVSAIPRFGIVHPTNVAVPEDVALAKADTAANASGALLVAQSRVLSTALGYLVAAADGYVWVVSDDLPVVGDMMYLSTANAGQAQKTIPAVAGTNQKRRLGTAIRIDTSTGVNMVLLRWQPEMLPITADGLA